MGPIEPDGSGFQSHRRADKLQLNKYEFWQSDKTYSDFYLSNRDVIDRMIARHRKGEEVDFSDLSHLLRSSIQTRSFIKAQADGLEPQSISHKISGSPLSLWRLACYGVRLFL